MSPTSPCDRAWQKYQRISNDRDRYLKERNFDLLKATLPEFEQAEQRVKEACPKQ